MKAVILAGGLGSRLKPFTETIPKPLLPVGEKAVLEVQIERFKKFGFNEIYLATNYKSQYIENFFGDGSRYGVKVEISREEKRLGTVGPISLLRDKLSEPFILMNGDILSLIDFKKFYSFAKKKKATLTLAIKKEITPFAFGNIFFKGDFVTGIQEKPDIITYILAGIYVMTPDIFNYIGINKYCDMDKLINKFLKEKLSIAKYEMSEYWLDIGRPGDYERAQEVYQKHFKDNNE
jgi:NDP-sugar pyrophosphorylase family protein